MRKPHHNTSSSEQMMARKLHEALADFERTGAKREAVKLARKILHSQTRLFKTLSLLRGKRDGLIEYMDRILHAIDEDGSDAVDDDFVPSIPTTTKSANGGVELNQRNAILKAVRSVIQKLDKTPTTMMDSQQTIQMGLELADAGMQICSAKPFEDLKAYIQHHLVMDVEDEVPMGPRGTVAPLE